MAESAVPCRNCGQAAGPRFCGFCGQALDEHRASIVPLVRELLEESLSLDGRTVRTLSTLMRPGRLTRLYLDGKRAPFLAPLRLYLFASVVLFSSAFALEPPDANAVNFYVAGDLITGPAPIRGRPSVTFMNQDTMAQRWLTTIYAENFARLKAKPPQEGIDIVFHGLRNVLPVALIAFLPLFALALKLLYVRRHVLYIDHLIFAAHFQAALYFAFASAWLIARITGAPTIVMLLTQFLVFVLMMTIYLGMALRRVYGESRSMTAAKTFVMLFAYLYTLQAAIGPAMIFIISRI